MAATDRPGGLSALGSLNLIFGVILLLVTPFGLYQVKNMELQEWQKEHEQTRLMYEAVQTVPSSTWLLLAIMAIVQGLLYLVSALGFFKMKRVLGYVGGNLAAVFSIIAIAVNLMMLPDRVSPFSLHTILNLFYPLLVLYLVNTVFREDLVR